MHRLARRTARIGLVLVAAIVAATASSSAATPRPDTVAIVNGTEVTDAEYAARWPFIVGLVGSGAESQFDGQFCGGSLIDDQHVLTAAHCVRSDPYTASAPTGIRIIAKTRTLATASLGSGETGPRVVSDVFIHPDFAENEREGFRYDVAVLRLAAPITGAATIGLVQPGETALWGGGAGGVDAFIAGWGDTDPIDEGDTESKFPKRLRHATIPLRSDVGCSATVNGGYGAAFERATNLCGGTLQSGAKLGTDTCQGDSGGPLIVAAGANSYRLAGVTSWGDGCAQRTFGSYSRVDALRGWIDSIPGATDGGAAIGGPGGTMPVSTLRRTGGDFVGLTLAWSRAATGTDPERFAIWRRTLSEESGDRIEQLVGITTGTSFRATAPATRRSDAYTWIVRPVDAAGSNGPSTLLQAGPRADVIRPTSPGAPTLVRAGTNNLVVRWGAAIDRQSGIDSYEVERRIAGRAAWVTADVTSSRSTRIEELGSLQRVFVRVRATDRAGNVGPWSRARGFTTR